MDLAEKKAELSDLVKDSQPLSIRLKYIIKYWTIKIAYRIVGNGLEEINKH